MCCMYKYGVQYGVHTGTYGHVREQINAAVVWRGRSGSIESTPYGSIESNRLPSDVQYAYDTSVCTISLSATLGLRLISNSGVAEWRQNGDIINNTYAKCNKLF